MARVKEGREEEFVEAWKDVLGVFFFGLPNPPGPGTLIRSVEDPQLFYSFGPWKSLDDIRQIRSDPRTPEMYALPNSLLDSPPTHPYHPTNTFEKARIDCGS